MPLKQGHTRYERITPGTLSDMAIVGLNLDPRSPDQRPDTGLLSPLGITSVRFPMHEDPYLIQYTYRLKEAGFTLMGMYGPYSDGFFSGIADWWQVGPFDAAMPDDTYVTLWQEVRGRDESRPLIAGVPFGLGPVWWARIAPRLTQCAGLGISLYDLGMGQTQARFDAYQRIAPDVPIIVTDWLKPLGSVRSYGAMLRQHWAAYWARWRDPVNGLVNDAGQPTRLWDEFRRFATVGRRAS